MQRVHLLFALLMLSLSCCVFAQDTRNLPGGTTIKPEAALPTSRTNERLSTQPGLHLHRDSERMRHLNQALIDAIQRNDTTAVLALLDQGADPNARDESVPSWWSGYLKADPGLTALEVAVRFEYEPMPARFVKLGGYPTGYELHKAPENVAVLRALLEHGANVNVATIPPRSTAFCDPAAYPFPHLDHGMKAHVLGTSYPPTPLGVALSLEKPKSVLLLLQHGADVHMKSVEDVIIPDTVWSDEMGFTAIKAFLDHLTLEELNRPDGKGNTLLMIAVTRHCVEGVRALLARHVAVNVRNSENRTAFSYTKDIQPYVQCAAIVKLLKAAGAKE